jgi:methionyl aminopeptidase
MISIKSAEDIEKMRVTCRLAAETLRYLGEQVVPGITTEHLDRLAYEYITDHGAYPSPLNYHGFPKSICTSPNEVVCHGIPSEATELRDGDILNIDVTTKLDGFHGDTNATFFVGEVSDSVRRLVETTHQCTMLGIAQVRGGGRLGDIGFAIQQKARAAGYSVVREFCGHGIGREFHEDPQVLHYGKRGTGVLMRPGMIFTIEPMINLGKASCRVLDDAWTAITRDGKWSAQYEHTILVTETGHEVLTLLED